MRLNLFGRIVIRLNETFPPKSLDVGIINNMMNCRDLMRCQGSHGLADRIQRLLDMYDGVRDGDDTRRWKSA